ncbi:MAG: GDSL-type esterase/lipase family protein [Planctomycetota bacterium]
MLSGFEWYLRANEPEVFGPAPAMRYMVEPTGDGPRAVRLVAGWSGHQVVSGREVTIRINAERRRGPEVGAREADEKRLLIVGDSLVFGFGVEHDETFGVHLESALEAELAIPVTVGNAGIPGLSTEDLPESLRQHADFGADAIVAAIYLGNDFSEDCEVYRAVVNGYVLQGAFARHAHRSWRTRLSLQWRVAFAVERFMRQYAPSLSLNPALLAATPEEAERLRGFPPLEQMREGVFMDVVDDPGYVATALDRTAGHLRELRRLAASRPLLIVLFPSRRHTRADLFVETLEQLGLAPAHYRRGTVQRRLSELGAALDVDMLDLTPELAAGDVATQDARWIPNDWHFSPAGHAQVAGWLLPWCLPALR